MVTFSPPLPDTASLGDAGHISDHNAIVAGLNTLNSGKLDVSTFTAKGSLVIGTAANITGTLTVGTNDYVLIADSSQATGARWALVNTANLADSAVTAAKIANDTITASQIAANAVGSSELADNAVDTNAIADSAVTSAKIADGTIVAGDVAAGTFAAFSTVGNLLTDNEANCTTDVTGWQALQYCAVARVTWTPWVPATSALRVTATAAVAYAGMIRPIPVSPGDSVTGVGEICNLNATGTRKCSIVVTWFNSSDAWISQNESLEQTIPYGGRAVHSITAAAPSGAAYARLNVKFSDSQNGDVSIAGRMGLWLGAGGKYQPPGTPIPGLSHIATNNAVDLSGTGSPEGVITAAPGSTFLQTNSTTDVKGWIRWQKATGTGSTGWVAGAEADTGWRNIPYTDGDANWTTGTLRVRRRGALVEVVMGGVGMSALGGAAFIYTLPTGFKNGTPGLENVGGVIRESAVAGYPVWFNIWGTDKVGGQAQALSGTFNAGTWRFSGAFPTFMTSDAWPTSLPGVAA